MPSSPRAADAARERTYMLWAAVIGLLPLPMAGVILGGLAPFPYPNDDAGGEAFRNYLLDHHAGEIIILGFVPPMSALAAFFTLLALVYMRHARRVMASAVCMIVFAGAFAIAVIAGAASLLAIIVEARGYPSFGTGTADLNLIVFSWSYANSVYTLAQILLTPVWVAVYVANRTYPLLPRALGGWPALAIAAINLVLLGSVFIPTGPWSPGSIAEYAAHSIATTGWVLAVSALLLIRCRRSPRGLSVPVAADASDACPARRRR